MSQLKEESFRNPMRPISQNLHISSSRLRSIMDYICRLIYFYKISKFQRHHVFLWQKNTLKLMPDSIIPLSKALIYTSNNLVFFAYFFINSIDLFIIRHMLIYTMKCLLWRCMGITTMAIGDHCRTRIMLIFPVLIATFYLCL